MIKGVGTDILAIKRLRQIMESQDSNLFLTRVYTDNELNQGALRTDSLLYYATRFAGKEAVFKSLGLGSSHIDLREIEILETESGQPSVNLLGRMKTWAIEKGITVLHLSLSYDTDYVVAFAVADSSQ